MRVAEERAGEDERAGDLLARADAARDARHWAEAAEAYGAYLDLRPGDRGILVQRGHCLKEDGDPAAALALYRRAEAMDPGDADIYLQIGHALKLLGRRGAAAESYGRAFLLNPADQGAWAEWRDSLPQLPPPRAEAGIALDLSDLVSWYGHRRVPSGIQRVQSEIAAAAMGEVTLCAMHPEEGSWRVLPPPIFLRLHRLSESGADPEEPAWQDALGLLKDWLRRGHALRVGPGTVLVTLGSAWWLPRYATALRALRSAGGRHVPVLHDCGPLVLPEFTGPGLRAEFGRWFSSLPVLADGVIAVSHATAAEYRRLMARHLPDWPAPPVMVVPPDGRPGSAMEEAEEAPAAVAPSRRLGALSTLLHSHPAPPAPMTPAGPAHPDLPDEPYVLLVSSLEPRKNHLLALEAWGRLIERRGAAGTPRLVFAGRRAPGDGPILAALAADPRLAARVTLLHELDDRALARLYRGCLFTLYPSRHEGWGLPVSESLFHRRVPVVAEIPALMESGRNGAVFFTPNVAEDLATAAEGLIADPARLVAAAARIPRHGGLRPWAEVAEDLLAAARRLAAEERDPPPPLPLCQAIPLGHGGSPGPHSGLARAELVLEGGNWHPSEDWGAWTKPGRAVLRLSAPSAGPARISLALRAPPGAGGLLRVALGRRDAAAVTAEIRAEAVGELALEIAEGGPDLEITLDRLPGTPLPREGEAPIQVGIGVVSVAVMHGRSPGDRMLYLENRILVPIRPG